MLVIRLIYTHFYFSNSDKGNIEITLVRVWREKSSPDDNDGIQRLMSN